MSQTDKLILHTDGGSRGNPGPAAAAAVLTEVESGAEVFAGGFHLGRTTNNVAEYQGLIKGLEAAIELGCSQIAVFTDSELMTRQIKGIYKVKNAGLKPLYAKVLELIDEFDKFDIGHVRRMHNKRADELVNMSLDAKRDIIDSVVGGYSDVPPADYDPDEKDDTSGKILPDSVRLIARCVKAGSCNCPAAVEQSMVLDLPGLSGDNNCIFAITGIVNALLAAGGAESFKARCAADGCGAEFEVAVNRI